MWTVFVFSLVFFIAVDGANYTRRNQVCECGKMEPLKPAVDIIGDIASTDACNVTTVILTKMSQDSGGDAPNMKKALKDYKDGIRTCQTNANNCKKEYSNAATHMERTAKGLDAGFTIFSEFSDLFDADSLEGFSKSIKKIADKILPFVEGIAPIIELFSRNEDSSEVQHLDQLLKVIEQGFMWMDTKFKNIEKLLSNIEKQISKDDFTLSINNEITFLHTVQSRCKQYNECLNSDDKKCPHTFTNTMYMALLRNIDVLHQVFCGVGAFPSFPKTVCGASVKHFDTVRNDVKKNGIQYFTTMIIATKDYLTIGQVLGKGKHNYERLNKMLVEVANRITWCDDKLVKELWQYQYPKDVDKWMVEHQDKTDSWEKNYLSEQIHTLLRTKYDWREWFVLISNKGKEHKTYSHIKFHTYESDIGKYNAIVHSIENNADQKQKWDIDVVNKFSGGTVEVLDKFMDAYGNRNYSLVIVYKDPPGQFWREDKFHKKTQYIAQSSTSGKYVLTFG